MKARRRFVIVGVVAVTFVIGLIFIGHWLGWETGFGSEDTLPKQHAKTLWDWLQLLIIPAVLAIGGYAFTYTTSKNDREATERRTQTDREAAENRAQAERYISLDNQREAALQAYIDKISELLLRENLRDAEYKGEARTIIRARTLTVLPVLDGRRKGSVIQFLYDANLVSGTNLYGIDLNNAILPYARLSNAFLDGAQFHKADLGWAFLDKTVLYDADLSEAYLRAADMSGANLTGANLSGADLSYTMLIEATLSGANLEGANLEGVILKDANLHGAKVTLEQLDKAQSLSGAIMPDGSKHP